MPFIAQPAGIYAYTGAAQVAAAGKITGITVDTVDGDTCIELTALVILHLVDAALESCIILVKAAVIGAVGAHLAPVVPGPNAALSSFRVAAQFAHTFHQVVAFDAPQVRYRHLGVSYCQHCFRSAIFFKIYLRDFNDTAIASVVSTHLYGRRCQESGQRVVHFAFFTHKIIQVLVST